MTLTVDEIDLADGVYVGETPTPPMARLAVAAIVASAIPVRPPRDWFHDPAFTEVTPLTIQSDGRAFGHIAGWKQDHIGLNGKVRAPHSRSNYAFFATGILECDNGEMVNVGQITLVGGHAPLEASVAEAVAHYDNTDSGVLDVAIGEDTHGIWVAGALRPEVDELALRRLRASGVSGDWRPINGALELVAVCSVNVPGFPIPRARVAAGQAVALVAAGTTEIVEVLLGDYADASDSSTLLAAMSAFDDRLRMVENVMLERIMERRDAMTAAIGDATTDIEALRARVHPRVEQPEEQRDPEPGELTAEVPEVPEVVQAVDEMVETTEVADVPEVAEVAEVAEPEVAEPPVPEQPLEQPTDIEALRARVQASRMADPVETPAPGEPVEVVEEVVEPVIVEEDGPVPDQAEQPLAASAWDDGMPFEYTFAECQLASAQSLQASLRARAHGDTLVAAPKTWSAEDRRKAKGKGQTMPDGSFPTPTKADWMRARQSLGRAKNPAATKRYLKKRARTLGIPKEEYANL